MGKDGVNRSWEKVGGKNPPTQVTCYLYVECILSLSWAFPSRLAILPPARLVGLPRAFSLGKGF